MNGQSPSAGPWQRAGADRSVTRRNFFARMTGLIAGVLGLGMGIPLLTFAIKPTLRHKKVAWADAGSVAVLTPGTPKDLSYEATSMDGWMKTSSMKSVWGELLPNGSVRVFSPNCPHLGCAYHWAAAAKEFQCPCHGSVFAYDGKVLAGPAPRPLDTLPSKIEDGRILVQFIRYQAGLPKKVPV
jgi:menaquinol-cytochrome c reductase iron-sulfur subunit